ncbi:MAG: glycosyltransferase family 1 protein [Candidatus Brocadiales bacterium]|nr:glycosyltransferase family 1 protein [Candidatus Brocadiales bacterium]
MIRVAVSKLWFPVTMGRYIVDALERRDDVELWSVGPFFNDYIPWANGLNLPQKYVKIPDLCLPPNANKVSAKSIEAQMPWKPDLFLIIDAGWHFLDRPDADQVALICTDPHVLGQHYKLPRTYSDKVFNMQGPYLEPGDIYWPYGYASEWFYPQEKEKIHDACAIGLQYNQRGNWVNTLRSKGLDVFYDIGIVYDEYREKYNESKLALSWSSLQDTPSRVWEAMGMNLPLISNRLSDMNNWFVDGEHYLGFDNLDEAVEKTLWALDNYDEALEIADNAYRKVSIAHTLDHRIQELLERCKLV